MRGKFTAMAAAVVTVAAGMVLVGCGGGSTTTATSTSTTTTTTVSAAAAMDAFRDRLQPILRDLGNGMKWIGGAAQSLDMADLRAACRSFDGNVDQLEAALPSPDPAITKHLTAAVTNWREMASICQGASLRMDDSDFSQLKRYQDAGYDELSTAVDLIKNSPGN